MGRLVGKIMSMTMASALKFLLFIYNFNVILKKKIVLEEI